MPKYHARETAEELARLHGASVFLGSATPSLDSYYRARQGRYRLFTLNERLTGGELPVVYVEDLRKELKEGNRSIFSARLGALLQDRLERGEQSMLFLNRRGYAGFVSCRMCGHVMKCPPLRRIVIRTQKRHAGVPLLRFHTAGREAVPGMRIQIYLGLQGRYGTD